MISDLLKCRASKIDITPPFPVEMGGHSSRKGLYEGIADPLEANLVILSQQDNIVFLLSLDILYVSDELKSDLIKSVSSLVEIKPEQLLMAASHTHYAPTVETTRTELTIMDKRYYDFLLKQLVTCFKTAWQSAPEPAQLFYKKVQANSCVNRRRKTFHIRELGMHVYNQPNPKGFKVEDVYMINVCNEKNESLAVCWSYACHPVAVPQQMFITSAYIGAVRNEIRSAVANPGIPVVFWQGFAGNLRNKAGKKKLTIQSRIRLRFNLPVYEDIISLDDEYEGWAKSLALASVEGLRQMKRVENISLISKEIKLALEKDLGLKSSATANVYFQLIQFSPSLAITAVSAEMMAEYVPVIKKLWQDTEVIPVGYINTVFGYWPTVKILKEGGYEGEESMPSFNLTGKWPKDLESLFVDSMKKLKDLASL